MTGNHTYSYGLYDSYQQTYYTPRFQQRQSVQGPDRFPDREPGPLGFHTDWLGSTRYMTNERGTRGRAGRRAPLAAAGS